MHDVVGFQRRRVRLLHLYTRGVPLRTVRDRRNVLRDFDRTVTRALARLPKNGATTARLPA